jgi:formylglycine-generating enzyme required for sulfatase activity
MKKFLLILLLVMVTVAVTAQNQGGEIRRPVRTNSNQGNSQNAQPQATQRTNRSNVASSAANNNEPDMNNALQNATRSLSPVLQTLVNNMVRVEGGTFTMGATSEQGSNAYDVEKPTHQVTLSSFSIGKYEVTQEEWEAVMGSNPSTFKGAKKPVEQVSWNDCQAFILKLNELTGRNFRLPTEAEWEFAARGGTKSIGYKYAGSDNLGNVAWYSDKNGRTTDVGQKSPNELGLYDMSGNVCEWCSDWFGGYSSSSQTNPKGPSSGSSRVNRGGSWFYFGSGWRVSERGWGNPPTSYGYIGLRLAM